MRDIYAKVLEGIEVVERPPVDVAAVLAKQEAKRRSLEELEANRALEEKARRWQEFITARGMRYAECRLSNFDCTMPRQTTAINKLNDYIDQLADHAKAGEGVVLFGSRGTGKDHLATAICRKAIYDGLTVEWCNGADLFADVRATMNKGAIQSENDIINDLSRADVLYLSDPLPPTGVLTEFQQAVLFRVLDARYSKLRPVIVTVNAANGRELDERIGTQNADRIRDGALAIHCDWPSHRAVKA